jgi:hypothetical protein
MADEPPNKRTSARSRVYKEGKIVFANGSFVIDCTIDSLSEDGAHVRVLGSAPIPKEFLLVEPSRGVVHKATIVRRTAKGLGLKFNGTLEDRAACEMYLKKFRR